MSPYYAAWSLCASIMLGDDECFHILLDLLGEGHLREMPSAVYVARWKNLDIGCRARIYWLWLDLTEMLADGSEDVWLSDCYPIEQRCSSEDDA